MPKIVKYAVIGAGSIAQHRHLPEAHANEQSTVVAIADPVKRRVADVAGHYEAKPFGDYRKMLADKSLGIDAVVVATPNALHAPMTIDALRAGYHVLCEKPMATSRADARKMIATAKQKRRSLMIGMNQRLMPSHAKAREILDTGRLGRVISFDTTFKHGGPEGWSADGTRSWFFKKKLAGMGVCGDLGVHKADLMRYLLGEEIVRVGGLIKTLDKKINGKLISLDDNAYVVMESASGTVGSMNISWTHNGRLEDNGTILYCQHGVMRLGMDPTFGVMVDLSNGQRERYEVGAMASNTQQVASGIIDAFTDAIQSRRKPEIDGMEGYRATNIIITAMEAAKAGRFKKVSLA